MRRFPNPWVVVPVLLAGIAGGIVGYLVTDASCAPGSCVVAAAVTAVIAGLVISGGVGVVAVLALKSLDEHRTHRERSVLVFDPEDE